MRPPESYPVPCLDRERYVSKQCHVGFVVDGIIKPMHFSRNIKESTQWAKTCKTLTTSNGFTACVPLSQKYLQDLVAFIYSQLATVAGSWLENRQLQNPVPAAKIQMLKFAVADLIFLLPRSQILRDGLRKPTQDASSL